MNIEQEIQAVHQLIILSAGYDVDIQGYLRIRQYEYSVWAVEWEEEVMQCQSVTDTPIIYSTKKEYVKEFEDSLEASEFFVKKRHELKLGLDYHNAAIKASFEKNDKTNI